MRNVPQAEHLMQLSDIRLNHSLYYAVVVCWCLNILFLAKFALDWHKREPARLKAWLALAAVAVPAIAITFFLPARGGYDNNHDFLCIGQKFFTLQPAGLLSFKELSPLFTDGISDILSGYSLSAILWKNRLLPVLSIFIFFTGLRHLKAGIAVSAAGTAFLFFNFLSALNASSFSTTSANMFIWLLSLLALFDAYASPGPSARSLAWIMSSMVLVISARFEFLPVNILLCAALLISKPTEERARFLKPLNLLILAAGVCLLGFWTAHVLSVDIAHQLSGRNVSSLETLIYQLGAHNLGVITGVAPVRAGSFGDYLGRDTALTSGSAILSGLFLLTALTGTIAGCLADRKQVKWNLGLLSILALWISYFTFIFIPLDKYPLHFIRQQLYFFLPFAYLFTLGLNGFETMAKRSSGGRRVFFALCAAGIAAYAVLNARVALGLNRQLRTNDREFEFLMKAQRSWPKGCLAVHPAYNSANARVGLIKKYFPVLPEVKHTESSNQCQLKYVSAEPAIFTSTRPSHLEQVPLIAGPGDFPWRAISFNHGFYTTFRQGVLETHEPIPVTIGFFRLNGGRDKAFLDTLAGLEAFISKDYSAANQKFKEAAAADSSCLNCKYFLAMSYAALHKKSEAERELVKIDNVSPTALSCEQRALIKSLAAGEIDKAARSAKEIGNTNSEFFFGINFQKVILGLRPATSKL